MTQNTTKIQGKFYPLQPEEWLEACRELTQAQLSLLYYIRTNDPYNQGVEINCAEIARLLSKPGRTVHRQTISRALKELDTKGFINLELLQVKAKVKAKGLWCDETPGCDETLGCDETPKVYEDTPSGVMTHHDGSSHTIVDRETPRSIATHHAESESLVGTESQNPKIIKTYLDFKDSLSQEEREGFLEFGLKLASQLPRPPQLPLKWVEKNWEDLRSQWLKVRDENQNQKTKYNFAAYSEPQHQMWYGQLQVVVDGVLESGDSTSLELWLQDDFYNSWLGWAKTARQEVREFWASHPILEQKNYGS